MILYILYVIIIYNFGGVMNCWNLGFSLLLIGIFIFAALKFYHKAKVYNMISKDLSVADYSADEIISVIFNSCDIICVGFGCLGCVLTINLLGHFLSEL